MCCVACTVSWAPWLLFSGVPARCLVLRVQRPGPPGSCSPVRPLGALLCLCRVVGHLALVHRCDGSVCCVACAVSWATWLLFTGVPARCVVSSVRCPGPLGFCSPVCPLGVLCCVYGVLGPLAPVHRCACSVCCVACTVSWALWLMFTGVSARCVVLRVRCLGPLGSCSLVCPLGVLCCVCRVLGPSAPVYRCARSVCWVACMVSWVPWLLFTGVPARCVVLRVRCPGPLGFCSPVCPSGVLCCVHGVLGVSLATWLLFTGVSARCVVLRVRCPGPLGSCSPVCPLGVLCCVCRCPWPLGSCSPVCPLGVLCCVYGVLGPLAPVHRCARSVCCVACTVSWATWLLFTGVPASGVLCCVPVSWAPWLLFTGVPAPCVVLRVPCPGPLGSCSPVCPLGVLCCVCGVLGPLAPVHRCARSVCCVACTVSWAPWLLFTGVPARCVVLRVRCPGPLGLCSPVCPLGVLCCVCRVLSHLAPVHRCACSVCCVACTVSWATWLLFTGVSARCLVLRVRCPGPLGSCSPVRPPGALLCLCRVVGHLAPVNRVPAPCVVLRVPCLGPLGSCSPLCPLGVLCCVCCLLSHLAPVHRCACSVCCVACTASWAPWLLFTGVSVRCVVLHVRCPGPLGSCSPVCPLGVLCCVCGVLGPLAPVHRCARSVCCVACTVSWATWLLFTGVPARCVVLRVRCPGPLGSCSPVCPLGVLCCVHGVLGPLAPVHRCARLVCCVACAVSWATWLLFTGVPARCVVLRVRCPGPLGSCSPVCPLGVLCCVYGVLGHLAPVHRCARSGVLCCVYGVLGPLAPVHRCARSVCCVACAVSWAPWLLFTGVPARCVVLRVRCPGPLGSCSLVCPLRCVVLRARCPGPLGSCSTVCPLSVLGCVCGVLGHLGSCSPVCPLGVLCCVCGVLGHLAPVHRCARLVCCVACTVSWATWLLFTGVPLRCVVLRARCPGPLGSCSPVCPLGVLLLRVPCPGPLGSCSPVCLLGVLCCVCRVLGHLAPVHRCARSVCCVACTVSWATWLLFTGVPARCVVLRVRCPGPLGSCSPVCPLGVLCCVCGVPGHLAPVVCPLGVLCCVCRVLSCAPVHRCPARCVVLRVPVSWAPWLLFTGVPARCVVLRVLCLAVACAARCLVLRVRCPGPLGSCSPVRPLGAFAWLLFTGVPLGSCSPLCPLGVLCCVCCVLSPLAPVHRCACSVCCVACTVSWAPWLLFTGVSVRCVVLRVRCLGPLGSGSPVCPLGVLGCVYGVLGPLAPVHRCARSVCCAACTVSWATWLLFSGVPARCVVLRARCPGPLGSCSTVCPLRVLCCVCGVLGHLAPVHRCARLVCRVACTVSWASWLRFSGVPARCAVLRVRCPGPLGSCSPVRPLCALLCLCGVEGHLAPVHRCAGSVCCAACTVSWAPWLLFTGVPARCVVLRVRCPCPLGSCSPACPLGVLCCVYGVLGLLAPLRRCARCVCCVACAVSWATWLLLTGLPSRCVVLRVRCPEPLGFCSSVCPLGVLCCVYGVLGLLAPVHRCARSVCCVACTVSWASWLLFTGVPARCVVLPVRCLGPLGSCSPVCPLAVLCCVCGFLGHLAHVHCFARSVCCVACTVSWAPWLLFTGVHARCVVLRVRCPGPLCSCSPVCRLGVLCCMCGVLGPLAPVHWCAR